MNYCSHCGERVVVEIPAGDNRPRHVCHACNSIHYSNPKIVTGCILTWGERILLCKRAIEPRLGYWTIPAGFMENQESTLDGALRESYEEANARAKNIALFGIYSITHISQVHIMYRGELVDGYAKPGTESLAVELVSAAQIPWQALAFPVVTEVLQRFLEDRAKQHFQVHHADIYRDDNNELVFHRHE